VSVTVGDVVGLPVIQQGEPEVFSARRWNEPIRWVHVSDVADLSHLLQGGELVLTTGAALRNSPETYLQGLAEARAAGVVVELGNERLALPEAAGRIAESLNLALVALHRVIRFVDVTEAVHRLIVAEQYEEVAFDRRVHETFTELSMKRASLPGIVDTAAQMLGEPVILEDLAHQALAVSAEGAVAATLLHDWERRSRRNTGPGGEAWTMTSVGPRSEEWGRLIIPHPAADPARAKMVLERASAALALHRMVERDRTGLQHQAQSGLIDDVLRSRITDEREVAARAQALGLRATGRYLPAVVRVDRSEGPLDPVAAHRRNVGLLDAVAHTVKAAGHTGLFSIRADGEIGVILALRRSHSEDAELTALGTGLRRETLRVDAAHTSVFALASAAAAVAEAIHALGEATHVAEVAVAMRGDLPPYFRASDVRLRGLLSLLRDDPRVQSFAETELKALVTADAEGAPSNAPSNPTSNLVVLREYLRLAGNKAALAKSLNMSRPALYKRLATIRRLVGVDLDDGESMTSLHVAMLILDTQNRSEGAMGGRRPVPAAQ
jgi:PucR family transcriptional regulator, purine catabolism regulatory protein